MGAVCLGGSGSAAVCETGARCLARLAGEEALAGPRGPRVGPPGTGGLGWAGSRPHPDPRDHGRCPSLRVTTGLAGALLSGRKACWTDDRPRTPQWHTREGDAAMPVCMGRARCLCTWGGCGWGCEARRVTRQCRTWPGPGPVCHAGGGFSSGRCPLCRALGGGFGPTSACPTLAQRGVVSACLLLLTCCCRSEGARSQVQPSTGCP